MNANKSTLNHAFPYTDLGTPWTRRKIALYLLGRDPHKINKYQGGSINSEQLGCSPL